MRLHCTASRKAHSPRRVGFVQASPDVLRPSTINAHVFNRTHGSRLRFPLCRAHGAAECLVLARGAGAGCALLLRVLRGEAVFRPCAACDLYCDAVLRMVALAARRPE